MLIGQQCWTIGINGTLITFLVPPVAKGGYGFDTTNVGMMYLAPIIAIVAGELFGNFVRPPRTCWGVETFREVLRIEYPGEREDPVGNHQAAQGPVRA